MADLHATRRRISRDFEQYLEDEQAQPLGRRQCTGCFREDLNVWHWGADPTIGNDLCEACWRTMHGHDVEEESVVFSMISSAVEGALDAGASRELVRAACEQALKQAEEREHQEFADAIARYEARS